jgi:ABC-type glutathione transport system ATPase component
VTNEEATNKEAEAMADNTLEIRNLNTSFFTQHGEVRAVNDVSLDVRRAQITGIVGESGCGKSMTARSVMGLVRYPGRIVSGRIRLNGKEITGLSKKEMCALAGISPASCTKMGKGGHVTTEVLMKICMALNCRIEDVMEFVQVEGGTV